MQIVWLDASQLWTTHEDPNRVRLFRGNYSARRASPKSRRNPLRRKAGKRPARYAREGDVKILLSAFACEPHRGSEPEVGWKWALRVAQLGHEVWVLTRSDCRSALETEVMRLRENRLQFGYYDMREPIRWWGKRGRGLSLLVHYALWQWGAVRAARELHAREGFDRVHHVTFAGVRAPSFMGALGIPFILGPIAGGERAPWKLRFGYG